MRGQPTTGSYNLGGSLNDRRAASGMASVASISIYLRPEPGSYQRLSRFVFAYKAQGLPCTYFVPHTALGV
jgi:hypothetical protein